jgi:hypothetical protein
LASLHPKHCTYKLKKYARRWGRRKRENNEA